MSSPLMDLKDWRFEIDYEDIAWAIFDREGESMNTIGRRPTEELEKIITYMEEAARNKKARGLIIMSGKENDFIAGADIKEFENFTDEREVAETITRVTDLFSRIEKLRVPTVAAIHGFCLGGGLELAMACDYRIADREDGTRLGLPEVKLGIFPGLHGTVRSIALAGPLNAMTMMLTGRMLRSNVARAQGLVDELVPTHHKLRWAARKAVMQKRRSKGASWSQNLMRQWPIRGYLAGQMAKQTARKARKDHYPSPFKLIDIFDRFGGDLKRMALAETRAFAPLMVSDQSRNLRRVFHVSEMMKSLAPKDVAKPQRAHIVGAGTMGADIAAWCVISGMQVSIQDLSEEQITKALVQAKKLFRKRLKKKSAVDAAMGRLIADPDGKHVKRADVIIEAIVERLDIKQKLFKSLEENIKPGAILATNTSSLPIEDIAEPLKDPARLIGLHFFNPVPQLPLVEVVRAPNTRQEEVDKGCAFVTAINKFPLITKSTPGFLVNRVLAPYMMDAIERFEQGTERELIDKAAREFGMPMGPLELADQVGLDVCMHVAEILGIQGDDIENSKIAKLIKDGHLGKKTGKGFYVWAPDGKPQTEQISYDKKQLEELGHDLVKPLVEECKKCLDEKVVESAELIDGGVIFGTGFAPFRGGPLHYAKSREGTGDTKTKSKSEAAAA